MECDINMKFYWNEKKQQVYCVGIYRNDVEIFMVLSSNEENKLDDEIVLTVINKYDDIVGKYETSDHVYYGDLENKTDGVFFEFLKD